MKITVVMLAGLQLVAGYPWVIGSSEDFHPNPHQKREEPTVREPVFLSNRKNTGSGDPNPTFNAAAQYVDITPGSGHAFQTPGTNDKRGPCPGLNAAANHNFIPRSGIVTTAQSKARKRFDAVVLANSFSCQWPCKGI